MAGNPNNVSLWDEADVFVLFPEDIAPGNTIEDYLPASPSDPFAGPWKLGGLLDGSAGFEESRDRDSTKHTAWGYGAVIASHKDAEYERTFTCLEDNPVADRLKSNNDTVDAVIVSTHTPAFLAFETRDRRGKVRRRITSRTADVIYNGGTENDSDLDAAEFTAMIYPDDQKRVFFKQDESTLAGPTGPIPYLVTLGGDPGTLTFRGETTATIAADATSAAVRSALAALDDGWKVSDWTVTGSAGGPYTVTPPVAGVLTGAGGASFAIAPA